MFFEGGHLLNVNVLEMDKYRETNCVTKQCLTNSKFDLVLNNFPVKSEVLTNILTFSVSFQF